MTDTLTREDAKTPSRRRSLVEQQQAVAGLTGCLSGMRVQSGPCSSQSSSPASAESSRLRRPWLERQPLSWPMRMTRPPQTTQVADLDFEASLTEFEELARSAGAEIAATLIQRRPRPDPATLVGGGKLEEIDGVIASTSADLVLFDHDLSPSQLRNLEAKLPCRVIDRTQLILDIFARHARTREGQLQVELAQLEYQLPRLAGRGKAMSSSAAASAPEAPAKPSSRPTAARSISASTTSKRQLESVRRIRRQQRQRREAVPVPVVALVGYTNAGKSTLFNALTEAGVLESSRMFATLDPKLRQLQLPSRRKVLLSDTVGFHPQPAPHPRHQLPRHARRGGACRAAAARPRRVQPDARRAEGAGREGSRRAGRRRTSP